MKKIPIWLAGLLILCLGAGVIAFINQQEDSLSDQNLNVIVQRPEAKKLIALGDMACPAGSITTPQACQLPVLAPVITSEKPDAVLLLGDLQYDKGSETDFLKSFGIEWAPLKSKSYAVPGNHEYGTPDAVGYFGYWNENQLSSTMAGETGKGYYSFNVGPWHVIALNSNCSNIGGCDETSAQGKWLKADLETHKDWRCSLAFWHHPRFSSGRYKNDQSTTSRGQYFWQVLEKYQADVILNGHDHLYERFLSQTSTAEPKESGMQQFTVGTGGKMLYEFNEVKQANHAFGYDKEFGYLVINLLPSSFEWEFKTANGKAIDSGSNKCDAGLVN